MNRLITLPLLLLPLVPVQDEATPAAPGLADLAWLAGHWSAEEGGVGMEELWTDPGGGVMLGLHRDLHTETDRLLGFEYLRIVAGEHGIQYLASPGGGEPTAFTLTKLEGTEVTFENLEHDFPQRVIYRRDGRALTARVEDASGERGLAWRWELAGE